ncbi:cation-translocating P-type ATPase [Vulgatibacter sp.]|uniref:cation-translocating P-type ATPase n=1 Tax=Vulgatibacter sp. TaxID=1971226 RepID=UPI003567B7C9
MLDPQQLGSIPWQTRTTAQALADLESGEAGITEAEVLRRRERYGPNRLPEEKRASLLRLFLSQFASPLIYVLLIAAAVAIWAGEWADALFIGIVLLVNAVIGTAQESHAETSAQALQRMMRINARVLRDGNVRQLGAEELVPGDVVLLESGEAVPADLRLLLAHDLRSDESLLTGESMPVEKRADTLCDPDAPLGDRCNLLFAGSSITQGRARGLVARTGAATEVGVISASLGAAHDEPPPLVLRLRRFSSMIAVAVLVAVILLFAVLVAKGEPLVEVFLLGVALAVSAIPEGLPVAITVALAIASRRMAKRNVIVRRLPAVEGLGACTLIASDKTGTLTANELTARRLRTPAGVDVEIGGGADTRFGALTVGDAPAPPEIVAAVDACARSGALANEAHLEFTDDRVERSGDAVDLGFLVLAAKRGMFRELLLEEHEPIDFLPYEPERKYAASFDRAGGVLHAHVKGAASVVLPMCEGVDEAAQLAAEEELAAAGYRVIALAGGPVAAEAGCVHENLRGLRFLGMVGLIDPIRPEVPDAVERCKQAGVDVRMVTGDHPATGLAIARTIGLGAGPAAALTGRELQQLEADPAALGRRVEEARVFARIEPQQKLTIVRALQEQGHFVAVTGDGVNDAPALNGAHIGVAMGRSGTDVARRAADLILTDDNFASIASGIEEGRIAYDNVRKVTWLLISTGVAEVLLFFLAIFFDVPIPLSPVQLLWLNLVTNGVQHVAISFERGEPGVLQRKPRPPQQGIVDRRMIEQTLVAGVYMACVGFGLFYVLYAILGWSAVESRNALLLLMVLFENAHVFDVRSERISSFRIPLRSNWLVPVSILGAHAIHVAAMYTPGVNRVLEVRPVDLRTWLLLVGLGLSLVLVVDLFKRLRGPALARLEEEMRVEGARQRAA